MNTDAVAGGVDRGEFALVLAKLALNRTPDAFEVGLGAVEIVGPEEEFLGAGWMPGLLLVEADSKVHRPEQAM